MVHSFLAARTWAQFAAQIATIAALIAAVASMAPTTPAAAEVSVSDTVAQRGEQALAALPFQPAAIGFTISFEVPSAGHLGLTFPDRNHIEIYARPNMTDDALISVVAHELGHAFDLATSTVESRNDFRVARSWPADTGWFTGPSQNDLGTPSGDYAECFATWAVGSTSQSTKGICDTEATALIASQVASTLG